MGAKLVPQYLENVTPPEQYELIEMIRLSGFVNRAKGEGRPTKRDGRELKKFTDECYYGPSPEENDDFDFDFDMDDLNP